MHIRNVFKEGELDKDATIKDFLIVHQEGSRSVQRIVSHYNLDVIISVGYRVKSQRGTEFRIWATKTLKDYIIKNYAVNQRFERIEYRVTETEKEIAWFKNKALPPVEGIFFDGNVFEAYAFAADLIKSAKDLIVLIDNYIDETVLTLLSKRNTDVSATIYTSQISKQFQLDLEKHHEQYPPITVKQFTRSHDRFLLIDNEVYHLGASLKDLGKKWFAFAKMEVDGKELLRNL